ncbi:hypothetical protein GGF32_007337 [Allomyces javanicus]|nr:hypothetical protein GGF32_007337 [Allomyces javanicus]
MSTTELGLFYHVNYNTKEWRWDDPRLSKNLPKYRRDFYDRLSLFRRQLEMRQWPGWCRLKVSRKMPFETSFAAIMHLSESGLKNDTGSITREFFLLISREIFNPDLGLFEYAKSDKRTLKINPKSRCGLAILHGMFLDALFVGSFFKTILKHKITASDMESFDAVYYQSLKWMLENDITDVLDLTMSTEVHWLGEAVTIDLIPGGRDIPVTEANKEYGLFELVPANVISVFDERELELLINGLAELNVEDWVTHSAGQSCAVLKKKLLMAIEETEGFGLE